MSKFKDRHLYIGGSDFGSVLDINPYKRRIELVLEKAQVVQNSFDGNAATRRGEKLESHVIELFEQETHLQVYAQQAEYSRSADSDCMKLVCHVDGMVDIDGKPCVFEAKTTDAKGSVWNDGIPDYYVAQLEFNMFLANTDTAYIAVAYCEGNTVERFEYHEHKRQMTDDDILSECRRFSQDVSHYKEMGVIDSGQTRTADIDGDKVERYQQLLTLIQEQKSALVPLENEKKQIESYFKKLIGTDSAISDGCYEVALGTRITSPSTDYRIYRAGIKIKYKGEK